ncbi:DNA internalization-related competence protein ComEC/Rec2 [Alkalicoccobacillus gibsonii]|uniref:DNA internalization-related competence protein ComEC/Rec2 n=1 Tax=Alkalicoccobacillus gibsonii TaxID=79881 RepID=UPI0019337580|nr:DNA internalization-related competence protein ComEC/Rec2 [Alkalicoccobacillus gibsonii]MBM0064289.1 DNA internalization-related competence protein ComEC/Rec2 [Alkalicoccobacillus gibsonii]
MSIALLIIYCLLQKEQRTWAILLALTVFSLFFLRGEIAEKTNVTSFTEGQLTAQATVKGIPRVNGDSISFQVKHESGERFQVLGMLANEDEQNVWNKLRPGDRCTLKGKLEVPNVASNFFEFDYGKYLYQQSIHWIYRINPSQSTCENDLGTWLDQFNDWRMDRIGSIQETYHESTSGLIVALTYGDRYFIDQDVLSAYEKLGVIHLLAVSGMHVGMLTAFLFYVFIRLGLTKERAMELLMIGLPFYAILAGAAPPVIRASSMSFIVLFCLRLKKKVHPLFGIGIVSFLFLMIHPYSLLQLGFQLSFLISFSLLISAPTIRALYPSYFKQMISVTLIAQLITLPLILYHFFEWNVISLPLNLIYIPFITMVALPSSFLASVFDLFLPSALNLPYYLLQTIVPPIHSSLMYINKWPLGSYIPGKPSGWQLFIMYGVILYILYIWESQRKRWLIRSLILIFIVMISLKMTPYLNAKAVVTMLDVGQGDSYVIELPRRKAVIVIDTGGVIRFSNEPWQKRKNQFDTGKDIVVPYLKAKGISSIDQLVLTHGDHDHIGGAEGIVRQIPVKELLYGNGPITKEGENQVLRSFFDEGTKLSFVESGYSWDYGDNDFVVLSPFSDEKEEDINERSIVIAASIEGVKWLFTGDLGEKGERRIIEQYPNLRVDILKAGHHGSLTSSSEALLDHIMPKVVLISAGRNNRHGHPHPEIMSRFEARRMKIYRTDLNGAVQFIWSQGDINVETMLESDKTGP